ncbi:hypothetical protein LXL04_033173 [Taraxacum kok-saghyz]
MESTSTITMVRLTPTNYNMWKPRMEDLLYLKELAEPLEKKGVKPDTKTDDVWMRINKKTVAQIRQWIDYSVFHHVSQETDAYKLWKKLENMYQAKTARNKTLLMRRLVNHKLRSGTSITEHTSQFQDLVNQLGAAEWVLKDEEQAILLLCSLPDNWETLVVTLSNSAPGGKVTMKMVTDALINEEARRKEAGTDQSYALVSEHKGRGDGRTRGRGRGRGRGRRGQSRGRYQDQGKSRERGKSTNTWFEGYCNHCNHYGHKKSDCRKLLREQSETSQSSSRDDGETMVTISQDITLVACENEASLHVGAQDDEWVIDTAASYHATPDQDLFATYKPGDHGTMKMGNMSSSSIAGIGDVHIKTKVGCTLVLKDVRHVPDLRMNLISVGALDRQNYLITFSRVAAYFDVTRTIVEKVRCMLSMAKLSKPLWGEAVSPSVPLNFEVPEKIWTGKDISYSHLRVFRCKAFAHVSSELRKKLDLKSTSCIFIGYGDEEFGYKLWDPELKKVIRSRDVVFYENQYYDSKSSVSEQQSSTISEPIFETKEDVPSEENVDEVDDVNQEGVEQGELPPLDTSDPLPEDANEVSQVRRTSRVLVPSTRYPISNYILLTSEGDPESFQEAQSHSDKKAMEEEMNSLQKNQTYELVKLPKGKKALKNKWVFKLKKDGKGNTTKYKARLVVKGFQQKEGIDFDEIFSLVVKMMSIRVVLGLVASLDLEIEQMDVKTAFLHGDLDEEIYMEQSEGFHVAKMEHLVCKLKKSLYGLKQAPRQWYKKFDSFMASHEYKRTDADHCVYLKKFPDGKFVILLLYVDDMLIVGQDATMIDNLKKDMSKFFDMKDLGPAQQILGMKITRDRKARKLFLSQEEYVERVIKRFNMENAKPVGTPLANHFKLSKRNCPSSKKEKEEMKGVHYSSAVGSLMYAMVCTRPDIAQVVGVVSRYLANPGKQHWEVVKWILRYLKGTSKLCLCYGGANPILEGYTDADMSGDLDNRKCTSSYIFTLAGGAISWQSKLQKCIALSTTEAEYIVAVEAGKELIWLKRFLQELGFLQQEYIIHCDSQSAMDLSKNSMYHSRTKHIDVRYHWLRQAIEEGLLKLSKIDTNYNPADMLTKVVTQDKHKLCTDIVGLKIVERRLEGEICWIQPPRSQSQASM